MRVRFSCIIVTLEITLDDENTTDVHYEYYYYYYYYLFIYLLPLVVYIRGIKTRTMLERLHFIHGGCVGEGTQDNDGIVASN